MAIESKPAFNMTKDASNPKPPVRATISVIWILGKDSRRRRCRTRSIARARWMTDVEWRIGLVYDVSSVPRTIRRSRREATNYTDINTPN
jgi:hypothetical protein